MSGILDRTEVVPGPAVESAAANAGDIVGDEIVPQRVALVGGAPKLAGPGLDGETDAVSDAAGENPTVLPVGIERENGGTVRLAAPGSAQPVTGFPGGDFRRAAPRHFVGIVRPGADRHEPALAGRREGNVAGGMAAARQIGNHHLRIAARG